MPWMYIVFNLQSARISSLYNFEMIHIFWSTVTTLPCYYLHDQDFDIFPRNFWARADIFVGRLHFALSKVDVLEDWVWLFGPRSLCFRAFGKYGDEGTGPIYFDQISWLYCNQGDRLGPPLWLVPNKIIDIPTPLCSFFERPSVYSFDVQFSYIQIFAR